MFKTVGPLEIVVILVIVLLVFGVGRIGKLGGELGKGIRAFKDGLAGKLDEDQDVNENNDNIKDAS
ncbi:MAG: twin-arginine translocase TatA/TatE family subunit [Chloroflexi bacterium]|nr:twin-arginine translocase TatA/TatE family subunit [Chloroflexota bacterium]